jgi:hypothetical protein
MKPVVAHELTHGLLAHLPLPRWLDEGIAVNVESAICPSHARRLASGWLNAQRGYWNETSIQEYWSGNAFFRTDKGSDLSYELAWVTVQALAKNYELFRRFASEARHEDSGQSSALKHLGESVDALIEPVLGPGKWAPLPETWQA